MAYTFQSPAGEQISLERNIWTGALKVMANGVALTGKRSSGIMGPPDTFELPSGITLTVRGNALDPVPKVEMDGRPLLLAQKLGLKEYLLCGIPLLLPILSLGGLLPTLIGALGFILNTTIIRSNRPYRARVLLIVLFSIAIIAIGFIAMVGITMLANGARR